MFFKKESINSSSNFFFLIFFFSSSSQLQLNIAHGRRVRYTETERLLTKSVCLLQLASMLLQESNDDASWIFAQVPPFFKKVFGAHTILLATMSKSHDKLHSWGPSIQKSKRCVV